jgi:hypothetical protein
MNADVGHSLYTSLAPWFHLLTAPEDYELDARHALDVLTATIGEPPRTVLELGSGGGNSASHMKAYARLTLTDLSEQMLELSRTINPEVEHVQGDMRTLRLERRTFDAVFVHDAVSYLLTTDDLGACATCSGAPIPTRATPGTSTSSRSCCTRPTARAASPTKPTGSACSRARRGSSCSPTPGSSTCARYGARTTKRRASAPRASSAGAQPWTRTPIE